MNQSWRSDDVDLISSAKRLSFFCIFWRYYVLFSKTKMVPRWTDSTNHHLLWGSPKKPDDVTSKLSSIELAYRTWSFDRWVTARQEVIAKEKGKWVAWHASRWLDTNWMMGTRQPKDNFWRIITLCTSLNTYLLLVLELPKCFHKNSFEFSNNNTFMHCFRIPYS